MQASQWKGSGKGKLWGLDLLKGARLMQTRLIGLDDPAGWNAALDGLPHAIAHTHEFVSCMSQVTKDETFLFVAESAQGKAVCPISERSFQGHTDVYTPYGFGGFVATGDINGLRDAWTLMAQERAYVAAYLMQNPVLMPREIEALWSDDLRGDRTIYTVDLKVPEAERWTDVSRRKRPQLRQWLEGAAPVTDQQELVTAFAELYPAFAKERRMASPYLLSAPQARDLAELANALLVGVQNDQGQITCVALMSTTPACGDYLFMASTPEGDADGLGVLWLGLRELAERGVATCNLGGGIREGDGVSEMKRRLGGQAQTTPIIQEIFDEARYTSLCEAAGVSHAQGGYFPAYYA